MGGYEADGKTVGFLRKFEKQVQCAKNLRVQDKRYLTETRRNK